MKKNNKLATILLASSLLLPGIAPIASGVASVSAAPVTSVADYNEEYVVPVVDQVVRHINAENAAPVAFVKRGDNVKFVAKHDERWFKVEVDGKEGFVLRGDVTSRKNFDSEDTTIHDLKVTEQSGMEDYYYVAAQTALRTSNAERYRPLKVLNRETKVKYLGTTDSNTGWFKVELDDGTVGYIDRANVTTKANLESTEGAVNVETVTEAGLKDKDLEVVVLSALRTQPGRQYRVLKELPRDTVVKYLGTAVKNNKQWLKVELTDGTWGYVDRGHVTKAAEVEELKVESVSAINNTGVDVAFATAAEEDIDMTVEVKDNKGKVLEVKETAVAAGDTEATFSFVTPLASTFKFEGVWTVNGVEYDFDLKANLAAVLNADNQVKLLAALNKLEIKNVKEENLPAYEIAVGELEVDEDTITVEDVQKMVDKVNTDNLTATEEKTIVEAVIKAREAGNQVALLKALQNEAFVRVNADWIEDYETAITVDPTTGKVNNIATKEVKVVQTLINGVNDNELKADTDIKDTIVDRKVLLKEKTLQEAYATPILTGTNKGEQTGATKNALKAIEQQLAIVDVIEATTPTRLKNAVVKLNALLDNADKIAIEKGADGFYEANAKRYISGYTATETGGAAIEGLKDANIKDVSDIEGVLTAVNSEAETNLVDAVKNADSEAALLKALKAFPGLEQVADTNKGVYWTTANGNFDSVTGLTDIQEAVNLANVTAITTATENTVIEKLNVLGLKNVVAANAKQYVEAGGAVKVLTPATVAAAGQTVKQVQATVQTAVDADNKTVIEVSELKAINEATTVAEVKTALDALANAEVSAANAYITVRAADRDFVAAFVLEKRELEAGTTPKKYDALSDLKTVVEASIAAHGTSLGLINGLEVDSAIADVVAALDSTLDETFVKLTPTQKVNVAGEFHDRLVFAEDGTLKTPFVTLSAAKALLK